MKITLIANTYPMLLEGSVKEQLQLHYSQQETKEILKYASLEYKDIIKRTPEIGGKDNMFLDIFYFGAYVVALYKRLRTDLTISELDKIVKEGIESSDFLKKKLIKINPLSDEYKKELMKASKWSTENKLKYPTNWIVNYKENQKNDGLYFEFSNCSLCHLCKQEGVPELMPSLCQIDYTLINLSDCKLERTKTIGTGSHICDFWIRKK